MNTPRNFLNTRDCRAQTLRARFNCFAVLVFWSTVAVQGQNNQFQPPVDATADSDESDLVATDTPIHALTDFSVFLEPFKEGGRGPKMVVIPAGKFEMGCLSSDDCYPDEKPKHHVSVSKFAIAQYEVTFNQYHEFAKDALRSVPHDSDWGRGDRPVINVSWYDAVAYTKWLSEETGATYRLPTESEWEYAGRAGTTTKYSWGSTVKRGWANCDGCQSGNTIEKTTPVGHFRPNPWKLFDMHGNVWEWTADCWNRTYDSAPIDGSAWTTGDCARRAVRGGCWIVSPYFVRSATRNFFSADNRVSLVGFRVVREFEAEVAEES